MADPFVIVGGDAAGMSAASKAKRDDPDLEVIVFEKGAWVSYAACGMPYFVKGSVDELEDLVAVTPETFREERGVDVRTGHEVVAIDREAKTVTVEADGGGGAGHRHEGAGDRDGGAGVRFEQPYGRLLIATGARAIEPPFSGLDRDGVFTLRRMDEADAIDRFVAERDPERAAIVGGGYVGVEMAEALVERGVDVTIFEMLPQILQPFGEETARVVEDHLREQGVDLYLETAVEGFEGDDRVEAVSIADGEPIPADMVIVGVGITPNAELAADVGIELGETGAIATDADGRTNDEVVFAAGDCAEAENVVTGDPDHVPLALTANRAGRAIGATVAGDSTPIGRTAGTAIVKAFELGAARTGVIDEERAREAGFDPVSVTIEAPTRPHYYPGGTELTVTLVADRDTGRVLGASLVGGEGTKRIDTVATALHAEMTVDELESLDLAYAPPFSPVWDPILTAAKVLGGRLEVDR